VAKPGRKNCKHQAGQALLIAVLIMMAILLVGALFVAIVNYNQQSSVRHSDMVAAQGLAEAGIRYADYMLQYSPAGADWRPPFVPVTAIGSGYYTQQEIDHGWCPVFNTGTGEYERLGFSRYPNPFDPSGNLDIGRGHFFLRVTYDPDPPYEPAQLDDPAHINPANPEPDPLSRYIRIESIGVVADEGFVFRQLVAYKPIALTDYLLFVTDRSRRAQPTILGYNPYFDMDNSGSWGVADFLSPQCQYTSGLLGTRYTWHGPMRFNTPVQLEGGDAGLNFISMTPVRAQTQATPPTSAPGQPEGGGYLRGDRFEAAQTVSGNGILASTALTANASAGATQLYVYGAGAFDVGDQVWIGDAPNQEYLGGIAAIDAMLGTIRVSNPLAAGYATGDSVEIHSGPVQRLRPPDLFAEDPATGTMRWYALTRDSGEVVLNPSSGETVNTGRYGHGQGIYIDNGGDIQFAHNINRAMQDWLHNLTTGSSWNQVGEMYEPPGVEIELFATEAATIEDPNDTVDQQYDIVNDPSPGTAIDNDYTDGEIQIWWPNHVIGSGEPGIRLERTAGGDGGYGGGLWCIADPNNPSTIGDTTPQTRTMYLDYPQPGHQVIFAEGNVRISGRLPRLDTANAGNGRYNLTVVSGGTIYIDGQLLSPQDQFGRVVTGSSAATRTGATNDQDNTYIALLARDCVVVNPTLLVPQTQVAVGGATAEEDDFGWHWTTTPAGAPIDAVNSRWYFGANPDDAGNTVNLVGYQTMGGFATLANAVILGETTLNLSTDVSDWQNGDAIAITPAASWPDASQRVGGMTVASAIGTILTLQLPGTPIAFSAGAYVENLSRPDCTGLNLGAYNPGNGWQWYDFDQVQTTPSDDPLFLITRDAPGAPANWFWEMDSLWLTDLAWPLLDASNGYLGLSGGQPGGMLNSLWFRLPSITDIQTANGGNGTVRPYWLKKFKIEELDSTTDEPTGAIHAKINAVMYAENGCFFVIPAPYFKEDETGSNAERFLRYNYDIEIRGAITENFHPGPAAVREWQEKWAWPDGANWNSIRYVYDETVLAAREQPTTTLSGPVRSASTVLATDQANLPKHPLLPVSPDLIYYGQ